MSRLNLFTVLLMVTLSALALKERTANAAIFGTDDRHDLITQPQMTQLGRATAIAVLTGVQTWTNGKLDLDTSPLDVCKDEKFASDATLDWACTGFLVGPDLLVTAGHCSINVGETKNQTEGYCKVYDWLFDYEKDASGKAQSTGISADRVYHCKQIIYAVNDGTAPFYDFALIQLDRPVTGRQSMPIAAKPLGIADPVSMIGFPLGTPMKVTDRAHVTANNPLSPAYLTDLDAMDGNSGSPVLNKDHEVVGILISGTPSETFAMDPVSNCQRYNTCDSAGHTCTAPTQIFSPNPLFQNLGSDVMRIAPLAAKLKEYLQTVQPTVQPRVGPMNQPTIQPAAN